MSVKVRFGEKTAVHIKDIIPNSRDHSWRIGIRLESMDYCGSESLAAIEQEWLPGFELE